MLVQVIRNVYVCKAVVKCEQSESSYEYLYFLYHVMNLFQ